MPGVPVTAQAAALAPPVIPAKAGTPGKPAETSRLEVPASAGMTMAAPALRAGALSLLLAGCAAAQSAAAVQPQAPGFWLGLWHGFIFPVAWAVSLFMPDVSIYAVPNNGGWYDFGYFLGIVVFGVGARKSAVEIGGARSSTVHTTATHVHHDVHHEEPR